MLDQLLLMLTLGHPLLDDQSVVLVWDIEAGEVIHELALPFFGQVVSGTWYTTDENLLSFVVGCADGSMHVYRSETEPRLVNHHYCPSD